MLVGRDKDSSGKSTFWCSELVWQSVYAAFAAHMRIGMYTNATYIYTGYIYICLYNHIDYMYTIVYEHVEHVDRIFGAEKELERQHEEMLELQRGLPLMRSRLEAVGMFATQSCLSWHDTCTPTR